MRWKKNYEEHLRRGGERDSLYDKAFDTDRKREERERLKELDDQKD